MIKTSQPHTIIAGFGFLVTQYDSAHVEYSPFLSSESVDGAIEAYRQSELLSLDRWQWPREVEVVICREGREVRRISVLINAWEEFHHPYRALAHV